MNDEFLGSIGLFPYDQIPRTHVKCDGSIVLIRRYFALFAVLNTKFGGDGDSTFGLPNLIELVPIGAGPGRNGVNVPYTKTAGQKTLSLKESNLAAHTHPVTGQAFIGGTGNDDQSSNSPKDSYLRATPGVDTYADSADTAMGPTSFEVSFNNTGNLGSINNMQPTIAMVYAICHEGQMPQRS